MSRSRRTTRDDVGMNLFPFLAVLICTMGSLIVLLVVMVQHARVRATTETVPVATDSSTNDASRREEDLAAQLAHRQEQLKLAEQKQQEIDDFKWQTSLMQESYKKTVEQLSEQRLALSHLESHTRQLSDEASKLQTEADMIQQVAQTHTDDSENSQQDISDLDNRVASARSELEKTRERLSKQTTKYSLVPYDGPNGTNRRPIYIECLADRVILQPENVMLRGQDFREPLTNENPLALALRAKREYLQEQGILSGNDEPYPLLVVRPGSAASYAAARAAMKAWESEFGYELVEADVELDYLVADPRLVRLLEDVIEDAREKQRMIRAMQASRAARGRRELLRPSAQGGFEAVPGGSRFGGRGRRDPGGNGTTAGYGDRDPFGAGAESENSQSPGRPSRYDDTGGSVSGGNLVGGGNFSTSPGEGLGSATGHDQGSGTNSRLGGDGHARGAKGEAGSSDSSSSSASGSSGQGSSGSTGQDSSDSRGQGPSDSRGQGPSGTSGQGSSGTGGQGSSGTGGPSSQRGASAGSAFSQDMSLAQTRGQNWALPDVTVDAVGITRPIRVTCDRERLALIPEKGSRQELQIFRHGGSIQAVIDPFVDAVQGRVNSWGIAGQGIYWKPILQVDIRADASVNYQQLLRLLENSGIEVTREP